MSIEPQLAFATPIWSLHCTPSLVQSLPRIVEQVQSDYSSGRIGKKFNKSNNLGAQSSRFPLSGNPYFSEEDRHEFRGLIQKIADLPMEDSFQTWINCGYGESYNVPHVHPGSILSGVLYLKTPEGSGRIVFKDPRPQAIWSELHKKPSLSKCIHLSPLAKIIPVAGKIIVFPSWLEHYVEPGQNQSELRISMPFNINRLLL